MRKKINPNAIPVLLAMLLTLLAVLFLIFLLQSCEVIKGKKTILFDTTFVQKKDSGAVKTNTATETKQTEWWKETVIFPPAKDCTINNYFNNSYPAIIIKEGGNAQQQSTFYNYDSAWQKKLDSLAATQKTTEKTKDTKLLTPWQIIAISIGGCLILLLLLKFASNFTILKKTK